MNGNGRHYIMDHSRGALDPRSAAGAAAAIVVAMINNTENFDIGNSDHREAVSDAIGEIVPKFYNTLAEAHNQDRYAE